MSAGYDLVKGLKVTFKELFKKYVNSNEKLLKYQQIQQKINKKQPNQRLCNSI